MGYRRCFLRGFDPNEVYPTVPIHRYKEEKRKHVMEQMTVKEIVEATGGTLLCGDEAVPLVQDRKSVV